MGITGLIPFLNKASKKSNITEFSGGTAAIDTYCWLHKGAFSCADKLIMGQSSDAYVKYCMKLVHMLIAADIKPILVFDGRHLPAKAETEVKRREQREGNKHRAAELMRMGRHSEGKNLLRRSIDISHEMALEVIKQCQAENIDCIVAPYEADAQLAYLNICGIADFVITEDSDLTLFGCTKIFFKMDINGNGLLVEQNRLHLAMGIRAEHFDMDKFRHMCILSGCDYLPSLPGIGLSKACKFILKNTEDDIHNGLSRIASYLNMKSLVVTKEYRDSFIQAFITFKHQLVYCPLRRKQVRLHSPSSNVTEEQLRYAGEELDDDLAFQLALGNCNPFTLKKVHNFDPDSRPERILRTNSWTDRKIVQHSSIWSRDFTIRKSLSLNDKTPKVGFPITAGQTMIMKTATIRRTISKKRSSEEVEEKEDEMDLLTLYKQDTRKSEKCKNMNQEEIKTEMKSPVLGRRTRNPFVKDANGVSPSLLSRTRRRTRLNIFTPTVIDDTAIAQSKFFTRTSTFLENSSIADDITIDGREFSDKENVIENPLSIAGKEPEEESHRGVVDIISKESQIFLSIKEHSTENLGIDTSDKVSGESSGLSNDQTPMELTSSQDGSSMDYSQVSEGSQCMDTQELLRNMNTQNDSDSDLDYSVDSSSINSVHPSLFKWANTRTRDVKKFEDSQKFKKEKHTIKRARRNSTFGKNSVCAQGQQSLLKMFGFQKKSGLHH